MSGIDHLIDTNVVIGLLKGHGPAVELANDAGLHLARSAVSVITRMELLGFPDLTTEEDLAARAFLGGCQVVGLTADVEIRAIELRRAGLLRLPDAIVAGSALATGAALLTLDRRMAQVFAEQRA
ncbi:MAG: type II toxin-antitoxin system VapC family toxin [Rhodocyclaceae bacterium]|nr:type II toxin-antitoxin system VapC family toxin [Rhodocyclaceae bacterium]